MPRRTVVSVLAATVVVAVAGAPAAAHDRTASRAPALRSPELQGGSAGSWAAYRSVPRAATAPPRATPRARCGPGSRPEPGIQGRVPREEVDSGRAAQGYWCNIQRVGQAGATGGFRVHRYVDRSGRECAYYDTTLLFPTNVFNFSLDPTGVAVLDMSDPSRPRRTSTLATPAMQTPHESLNISVQRGILAAVMGNPAVHPGGVDVYDIGRDCRYPEPMAAAFPATPFGHESGMAPDGLTFYPSSASRFSAVDISNPRVPRNLWNSESFSTHGMSVSDDGRRGYLASIGQGLVIVDLSEIQDRKPNPQVREIGRVTWPNITIPQVAIPVTIGGRRHVVEVDEFATDENGRIAGHGDRVGAARIVDVSDERRPFVVSNVRLEVHQKENRPAIAGDYGARNPLQGYAAHYCNVPRRDEPGILACSMIASGLRVFDIRDPARPREIAYHVAPPSHVSETGAPLGDERANWAMSQPAFAPERGEIWYSDGTSGFHALRLTPELRPLLTNPARGSAGCVDVPGIASVGVRGVRGVRGGVRLNLARRRPLPVEVDVYRVSQGRRVVFDRRVARFPSRTRGFTWRTRLAPGIYFARFRMLDGGRVRDTQRVVFGWGRGGLRRLPDHYRRDTCTLLRTFKLQRPAFGGVQRDPLRMRYRLARAADVTVTVSRGRRVVRRFATVRRSAGPTHRLVLSARGLPRGDYRVRMHAVSGEDQLTATLASRRL